MKYVKAGAKAPAGFIFAWNFSFFINHIYTNLGRVRHNMEENIANTTVYIIKEIERNMNDKSHKHWKKTGIVASTV